MQTRGQLVAVDHVHHDVRYEGTVKWWVVEAMTVQHRVLDQRGLVVLDGIKSAEPSFHRRKPAPRSSAGYGQRHNHALDLLVPLGFMLTFTVWVIQALCVGARSRESLYGVQ